MTFRASIQQGGHLYLGPDAEAVGFVPGTLVEIIVTRAGSVILAIDSAPASIPARFRALTTRQVSRRLQDERRLRSG